MNLTKRQQQKETTKKRIAEAAYAVYAENGFASVTNDIAKGAGVSHGAVFAHFPTREDLIIYILEEFREHTCVRLHELAEKSRNLRDILEAHLEAVAEHEKFYMRLIAENRLLPAEVRNIFISVQSTIAFHFEQVVEKEKNGGTIKDLPNFFIFNLWIGLIHYYLQNSAIFASESLIIEHYKNDFINYFLETIRK